MCKYAIKYESNTAKPYYVYFCIRPKINKNKYFVHSIFKNRFASPSFLAAFFVKKFVDFIYVLFYGTLGMSCGTSKCTKL